MSNTLSRLNSQFPMFGTPFDSLFALTNDFQRSTLNTDYFVEGNEIILNIDVAGSSESDVKVVYHEYDNTIEVSINKQYERKEPKPQFFLRERTISHQSRRFSLPKDVDTSSIKASVKDGLLTIKAKKIDVKEGKGAIEIAVNSD